jgi:hypothetical protein
MCVILADDGIIVGLDGSIIMTTTLIHHPAVCPARSAR